MFPLTRIYTDSNGDSRFEDLSIPMNDAGEIGKLSEGLPVTSLIFRENSPSYDYDFHNAPQNQYLVLVDGGIEIETEDTTGKGHKTKNLEPEKRRSIFITIP